MRTTTSQSTQRRHGRRATRATSGLLLLIAISIFGIGTASADTNEGEIAIEDVVAASGTIPYEAIYASRGDEVTVSSVGIDDEFVDSTCLMSLSTENNTSNRSGTDVVAYSGNHDPAVIEDVEEEINGSKVLTAPITLGSSVEIKVRFTDAETFSGGGSFTITCQREKFFPPATVVTTSTTEAPAPTPTTAPPATTTSTIPMTTWEFGLGCPTESTTPINQYPISIAVNNGTFVGTSLDAAGNTVADGQLVETTTETASDGSTYWTYTLTGEIQDVEGNTVQMIDEEIRLFFNCHVLPHTGPSNVQWNIIILVAILAAAAVFLAGERIIA